MDFVMLNWFKKQEARKASGTSVHFSPWAIRGNDIVREYDIELPDQRVILQFQCTLGVGTFGDLQRYVHFLLAPSFVNGECHLATQFCKMGDELNSPSFTVYATAIQGDATLINVPEREQAEMCVQRFATAGHYTLRFFDDSGMLVELNLPNNDAFANVHDQLADTIARDIR